MSTVGNRLKTARKNAGLSQVELARQCNWENGQKRISNYESDIREPGYSELSRMARVLGVSAAWLAFGGSNDAAVKPEGQSDAEYIESEVEPWDDSTPLETDEVAVPFFTEVEAAAGMGNLVYAENHGSKLRFAKSTLRKAGVDPENVVCVRVAGNSMEPVIPDGAVIGVDTASVAIKDGEMFAIKQADMLRVKVMYRLPTGYRLKSFNDAEWPLELVEGEDAADLKVIGRVFWYSVLR